jgi:SAM-dependent methyltransferase
MPRSVTEGAAMYTTKFTTMRDMKTEWYKKWQQAFGLSGIHRKGWEVAIIAETLESHGLLAAGYRGIEYGCGSGLVSRYVAAQGANVLATDLLNPSWVGTHSGFGELANLQRVETRVVDMNWLNGESGAGAVEVEAFDFSWSICSMDHCGSTWLTKRFLLNQLNCLKPGGLAVHTAEYTISVGLPRSGGTAWLDWTDMVDLQILMQSLGHELAPIDWNIGDCVEDHMIDMPPYGGPVHLKPEVSGGRWGTCVVFAAKRGDHEPFWVPVEEDIARASISAYQRSHSQT